MKECFYLSLCIIYAGCSNSPGDEPLPSQIDSSSIILQIVDSVGVETGDENYVFGSIESMCFGPDGNIALLDRAYSQVRIFSSEGEYLKTIGGQGSGPGELNMTIYMGISHGGNLFVSQRSGCNEFDYLTGEWITLENFNAPPPISITGSTDSFFVAISMEMVETDEGLGIDASVSRFTDCYSKDVSYTGSFFELNPADMSSFFQKGWYGYCFDVDQGGNVFVAESSRDEYLITGYTPEGEPFLTIEKPFDPVAKTEEEIQQEKRFLEARFESLGMGRMGYTPLPDWPAIRALGVDGQGRIWAQRGSDIYATFDVYDSLGNDLFTAVLPFPEQDGRYLRFQIEPESILAWPEDPQCGWQKFYIIALPD